MHSTFILPPKLQPGDRVRLVSPASTPLKDRVARATRTLEGLGLKVEIGTHVYDVNETLDYLAGKDEDRLADFNDALRDPGIKAVIATCGGKGAYRIADKLDFEAARTYPKLVVGFSEITILHMALLKHGLVDVLRQYSNRPDLLDDLERTRTRLHAKSSDGVADLPALRSATRPQPHAVTARLTPEEIKKFVARYLEGARQRDLASEYGLSLSSVKRLLRSRGARKHP